MRSEAAFAGAAWPAIAPGARGAAAATLVAFIGGKEASPPADEGLQSLLSDFISGIGASGGALTVHGPGGALELASAASEDPRLEPLLRCAAWAEAIPMADGSSHDWFQATHELPWHRLSIAVGAEGSCRAVVSVFFAPDPAPDREAAAFVVGALQPGAARYMRLWLRHRAESRTSRLLEASLAKVDYGLVLLDADAKIVFENPAASAMLDRGAPVYRCRGSVAAREPVQAVSLRLAIDRALFGPAATAHGDAAAAPLIALGAPGSASPLLAAVSAAGAHAGGDAVALHLFEAAAPTDRAMAAMARWHGLSPMEAHLVAMLAGGHGVAEIAQQSAVKEDTVRTYLKNVFRKTRTKNQADLIRLMMSNSVCLETDARPDQDHRNISRRGEYVTGR